MSILIKYPQSCLIWCVLWFDACRLGRWRGFHWFYIRWEELLHIYQWGYWKFSGWKEEGYLLKNPVWILHTFYYVCLYFLVVLIQWTICYWRGVKTDVARGRVKWGNRGGRTGTPTFLPKYWLVWWFQLVNNYCCFWMLMVKRSFNVIQTTV